MKIIWEESDVVYGLAIFNEKSSYIVIFNPSLGDGWTIMSLVDCSLVRTNLSRDAVVSWLNENECGPIELLEEE